MIEIIIYVSVSVVVLAVVFYGVKLLAAAGGKIERIENILASVEKGQERGERALKEDISSFREEFGSSARQARAEQSDSLKRFEDTILKRMSESSGAQKDQLDIFTKELRSLAQSNETRLDKMRETVEARLRSIQEDNNAKLEKMRVTVDEKLHDTLEQKLAGSFNQVREQLNEVHKGLGEMRLLAADVGNLQKALTGVKSRGLWGEVQLGSLLEQILSPEQYASNVATREGAAERVEYAIKLPGRDGGGPTWIPIDAKFPLEHYQRLVDAQEAAEQAAVEEAGRTLEARIKQEAKKIRDKYLDPPNTTDFGVMFLPTEGLYAEVVRRQGLCDFLLNEMRVIVTGPTTLTALLNSLQVGFRTLAIEKRAGEVWRLLSEVKTEFQKFGTSIEATKKRLEQARASIDSVEVRTRAITRKLTDVQELPSAPEESGEQDKLN